MLVIRCFICLHIRQILTQMKRSGLKQKPLDGLQEVVLSGYLRTFSTYFPKAVEEAEEAEEAEEEALEATTGAAARSCAANLSKCTK